MRSSRARCRLLDLEDAQNRTWIMADHFRTVALEQMRIFAVPGGASVGPAAESPVKVEGGADQGQVSQRLREVAQRLAARASLFCVQAEVVAVTEHLLEQQAGLREAGRVHPPGPG